MTNPVPTFYEKIPVPGHSGPIAQYVDPEILYSTVGYTQKGVTLAGGQGVLQAGTVLARNAADKKYYAYSDDDNITGEDKVARGILRRGVDMGGEGSADQQSNMVIMGIVKLSMVKGADEQAVADLGARTDPARDTFRF